MKTEPVAKFVFGRGNFWELYLDKLIIHTSAEMRTDEYSLRDIARVVVRHNPDALKTRDVTLLLPDGREIIADRVVDSWNLDKWLTAFGRYRPDLFCSPNGKRRNGRSQPTREKDSDQLSWSGVPSSPSETTPAPATFIAPPQEYDSGSYSASFSQPSTSVPSNTTSYLARSVSTSSLSPDSQETFASHNPSSRTWKGNEKRTLEPGNSAHADRQSKSKLQAPLRPWVAGRFTSTAHERFADSGSASWENWNAASNVRPASLSFSPPLSPTKDLSGQKAEESTLGRDGLPALTGIPLYTPPPQNSPRRVWEAHSLSPDRGQEAWEPGQSVVSRSPDPQKSSGKDTRGRENGNSSSDGVITSHIAQRFGPPFVTRATDHSTPPLEGLSLPKIAKNSVETPFIKRAGAPLREEGRSAARSEHGLTGAGYEVSTPINNSRPERSSSLTRDTLSGASYQGAPAASPVSQPFKSTGNRVTPVISSTDTSFRGADESASPMYPATSVAGSAELLHNPVETEEHSIGVTEQTGEEPKLSGLMAERNPSRAQPRSSGFTTQFTALFGEFDAHLLARLVSAISSLPGRTKPASENRRTPPAITNPWLESARKEFKERAAQKVSKVPYTQEVPSKPSFPMVESSFTQNVASSIRQHSRLATALGGLLLLVVVVAVLNATFGRSIVQEHRSASATQTAIAANSGLVPVSSGGIVNNAAPASAPTLPSLPPVAANTPATIPTPKPVSTVAAQPTVSLSIIPTDTPQATTIPASQASATPQVINTPLAAPTQQPAIAPQATNTPLAAPTQQPATQPQPTATLSPTATTQPQPTATPQPLPTNTPAVPVGISVIYGRSFLAVAPGGMASITVQAPAGTQLSLTVQYSSGAVSQGTVLAGANNTATWSFPARLTRGSYPIFINGTTISGQSVSTSATLIIH